MKINHPHISGSIVLLDIYPNVHGKDYGNSLACGINKQMIARKLFPAPLRRNVLWKIISALPCLVDCSGT